MDFAQKITWFILIIATFSGILLCVKGMTADVGIFILILTIPVGWGFIGLLAPLNSIDYDVYLCLTESPTSLIGVDNKGTVIYQTTDYTNVTKGKDKKCGHFIAHQYLNLSNFFIDPPTYELVEAY